MDFLFTIFNTLVFQPFFNILILLYQYIPGRDFGVAVIALTLLIRAALYPVTAYGVKVQKRMADLQPKIEEIKERFKNSKQEQGRATMELYKQEGVNPFAGIFPLLIQLPIFIALFQLFGKEIDPEKFELLYFFVPNPGMIDPTFLGILNLGEASFVVALFAGAFQFIQSKQAAPPRSKKKPKKDGPDFASMMQTQMIYVFPLFTVFIVARFPSALGVYWIVTSLFTIGQHWYMTRKPEARSAPPETPQRVESLPAARPPAVRPADEPDGQGQAGETNSEEENSKFKTV